MYLQNSSYTIKSYPEGGSSTNLHVFESKENSGGSKPFLQVDYTPPNPNPKITSITLNGQSVNTINMKIGQSFTLRVTVLNNGSGSGQDASIQVSFPNFTNSNDISYVTPLNMSSGLSYYEFRPGIDNIWEFCTNPPNQQTANYVLVSASKDNWAPGESNYLELQITPQGIDSFPIYIKSAMSNGSTYSKDPTDNCSSCYQDQQCEKVYDRYAIVTVDPPTNPTPQDEAKCITTNPTLSWSAISGVNQYEIKSGTNQNCDSNQTYTANTNSLPLSGLNLGITYHWYVRAVVGSKKGPWSSCWSFTTTYPSLSTPLNPDPQSPANCVYTTKTLSWSSVSGAQQYEIRLGTNPNCLSNTPYITYTNSYTPSSGLQANTPYYWTVRAFNDCSTGPWSSCWSFTTGTQPLVAPTTPNPSDGATDVPLDPTLSWSNVPGSQLYQIRFGTNSDCTQNPKIILLSPNNSYSPGALSPNTDYYWSVSAGSNCEWGPWSNCWHFKTLAYQPKIRISPTTLVLSNIGQTSLNSYFQMENRNDKESFIDQLEQVESPYFYYYSNRRIPLEIDTKRIAIWGKDENFDLSLQDDHISILEKKKLPVPNWHVLKIRLAESKPNSVEILASQIAGEQNIKFVSPVFVGKEGGEIIITPKIIVGFKRGVDPSQAEQILDQSGAGMIIERSWGNIEGVFQLQSFAKNGFEVLQAANRLAELPEVKFAEPNMLSSGQASLIPNDPGFDECWGIHNTGQSGGTVDKDMDGPEAWDISTGNSSVIVVIIDSGVQQDHPDINQISGTDTTSDGGDGGPVNSHDNHGTAVAGCVSAIINNSTGTVGIAPNCRIASARAHISDSSGFIYNQDWIKDALTWAESIGARVTNNSNHYDNPYDSIDAAYKQTRNNGMIHFAAAGNAGSSTIDYPAYIPSVNSVAALDRNGVLWSDSNHGEGLDFSAPGVDIYTTDRTGTDGYSNDDYTYANGTSLASPYAAGVAALVLSVNNNLNATEVEKILKDSSIDLGSSGYDTTYGWGFINAFEALQLATGFNATSFTIFNDGLDPLQITSMTKRDNDPWLSFSPQAPLTIPHGGSQVITVSVNWGLANVGTNDEQILVYSNDTRPNMSPYPNAVYVTAENSCTTEICNGVDDDCDGQIDEGVKITYYRDADGDGYGNKDVTIQACSAPSGYVTDNTDCNDSNAQIHPNATEILNGVDDDCDGQIDEGLQIAPVINAISDHSTLEGTPYTGPTPTLSKGTPPVTWSLVSRPSGMTIDSVTGVVSWANPTASGSPFTVIIRATNSAGSDDESWQLTVTPTYTISGTITGDIQAGVTMTISGPVSKTTATNSSGNYSFTGLSNGTYTVTPSLTGYTFTPTSRQVQISGANVTGIDFVASKVTYTYSISGTITGDIQAGVTIAISGPVSKTTATNSSGNYSFTGLSNGTYTVTPSLSGYSFSPSSKQVTIAGANVTGIDFVASKIPYSISGTITGDIQAGVTITISGPVSKTTATNSSGNYSATGLSNGSYTVTPSLTGYTFSPTGMSVTISGANQTANFTAIKVTYSISGTATYNGTGLSGVTMTLTGSSTGSTATNSSGNYSFTGLSNGTYTVTPSLSGYTFTPTSKQVTISGANQTANFTAIKVTYSISGTATYNGTGLSGVTMTLSGSGTGSKTTDASGNYSFTGLSNGTYTVTPSKTGYTFTPSSKPVTVSGANQTGVNFTAVKITYPIDIPQTGQKKCYDTSGTEIYCTGTGQDGEIQSGVAWPDPRFTDNGDETVTDNLTGLVWTKNGNVPGATKTWQEALDYVAGMNAGIYPNYGYTDWRLPNVNELRSLNNAGESNTAAWLNTQYFTNVQASGYWSSTTYAGYTDYAWRVHMNTGYVGNYSKSSSYYVWPVRSGQCGLFDNSVICLPQTGQTTSYYSGDDGDLEKGVAWPDLRFTDNGDETVTDNLTGLMWTKDANLPGGTKTWQNALDYVKGMNNGTYNNFRYTDWRLPNVNELESLVNGAKSNTATWLNTQGFTNVQANYYWSSTTLAGYPDFAWIVSMWDGYVFYNYKSVNFYVWPVRGGQIPPLGNSISGTVTYNSTGLSGVTMTLTGASTGNTTTDSSGNYSFTGLSNGSYTVTPSKTGYTFTPSSKPVTVSGTNQTGVNFTASAITYSISGTVTLDGTRLGGVTMTLSGASSATTTSDGSGNYSFTGLSNGTYTVTPSLTGYTFSPTGISVTISGANQTEKNFTATAVIYYNISGTVTYNGTGLSGVTMTMTGNGTGSTITDGSGNYSFTGLSNGTYTVTPSLSGYIFTPTGMSVTISGANQTGKNFTATAVIYYNISGTVSYNGTGLSGVTMTLSGSGTGSETTDASGNYIFTGLSNGTYTVTPSLSGYIFTPTGMSVTISGANKTGVNFTASTHLDTQAPTIESVVVADDNSKVTVYLTDNSGKEAVDISSVVSTSKTRITSVTKGGNVINGVITNDVTNVACIFTPSAGTFSAGDYTVNLNVADKAGNSGLLSGQFTVGGNYSISGTVTYNGTGLSSVTVTLLGSSSGSTTTSGSGSYSFSGLNNGTYTVTPTMSGYSFSPSSYTVTISGTNQTGVNFTAVLCTGPTITVGTVSACASGAQVEVPVTISDTAGRTNLSFSVSFDNTTLQYTGITWGIGTPPPIGPPDDDPNATGKVQIFTWFEEGVSTSGTICAIKFTLLSTIPVGTQVNLTIGDILPESAYCGESGGVTCGGEVTWSDVIDTYNDYVSGEVTWDEVIAAYQAYANQ